MSEINRTTIGRNALLRVADLKLLTIYYYYYYYYVVFSRISLAAVSDVVSSLALTFPTRPRVADAGVCRDEEGRRLARALPLQRELPGDEYPRRPDAAGARRGAAHVQDGQVSHPGRHRRESPAAGAAEGRGS